MAQVVLFNGPSWFTGIDMIIDLLGILILLLVAWFSWRHYQLDKSNKRQMTLTVALSMIAASFLMKILSYYSWYMTNLELSSLQPLWQVAQSIAFYDTLYYISFLLHSVLGILGLLILYLTYDKNQSTGMVFLSFFLAITLMLLSQDPYTIFHLTSLVLTAMITYTYWQKFRENNVSNTSLLAISFAIIAASQLIFMFSYLNTHMYVVAEGIQLAGYLLILFVLIMVLKNAKKKG